MSYVCQRGIIIINLFVEGKLFELEYKDSATVHTLLQMYSSFFEGGLSWPEYTFNPPLIVPRFTLCFGFYFWVMDFVPHREIQLWGQDSSRYFCYKI